MSLGTPRSDHEKDLNPLTQAGAAETAQPQSFDLNKAIERLRDAVHDKNFVKTLAAYLAMPDQTSKDIVFEYIKPYPDLMLYFALATREGFSWENQLDEANANIARINAANVGLNLQANYELPLLIQVLAEQNNPNQLMANLELMKKPMLVIAPQGLALNHLIGPLTINQAVPNISNLYDHATPRTQTAVYLIDAGDLADINTQPEAVKLKADDNDNCLNNQKLRQLASDLGMKLDEYGYCLLAAMLRQQEPASALWILSTPNIFTNKFANGNNSVAFGIFFSYRFFLQDDDSSVYPDARIRPSVMAEL